MARRKPSFAKIDMAAQDLRNALNRVERLKKDIAETEELLAEAKEAVVQGWNEAAVLLMVCSKEEAEKFGRKLQESLTMKPDDE